MNAPDLAQFDAAIANATATLASLQALRDKLVEAKRTEYIDQESSEPLSPRAYLEHARKGDYPTKKVGRRVLCRREDFEAFLTGSRRQGPEPSSTARADVEDAIDAAIDLAAERIARRGHR